MRWTVALLLLAGCLPVDDPKPECFPGEGCANGAACVAGRCVERPGGGSVAVVAGCLGAADGACHRSLQPHVFDAPGNACLVVEIDGVTRAAPLYYAGGRLVGEGTGDEAEVTLEASAGQAARAALFLLSGGDDVCASGALRVDTECGADASCALKLETPEVVLDEPPRFEFSACEARWAEPVADLCDGADEDCDGRVDEDFADLGDACSVGVGVCRGEGVRVCGVGGTVCDATFGGEPGEEVANGLDDDCDGGVDEGLAGICDLGDENPCGDDVGRCRAGLQRCVEGPDGQPTITACLTEDGEPVVVPNQFAEICNGVDDNCDGNIDEGLRLEDGAELGAACSVGAGRCLGMGTVVCQGDVPVCDAIEGRPALETCNGADDDCDGETDEDFGLGVACMAGVGACERVGEVACDGVGGAACDAELVQPEGPELCGNGVDDDCDGETDEDPDGDAPRIGDACVVGQGVCQRQGLYECDPDDRRALRCDVSPGEAADEVCNQLDDDCDGAADEDFDLQGDPDHCGACGRACELPQAISGCLAGGCTVAECVGDFVDRDRLPANGCECDPSVLDLPDPEFVDDDCDGVDGDAERGVFVSPGGDDGGDGSMGEPVATLARALALSEDGARPILVAEGSYELGADPVLLPSGVHIHGGYLPDPEVGAWLRGPRDEAETELRGALRFQGLAAETLLDNLTVRAPAAAAGASSVAVDVEDGGAHLTLRRVLLVGGRGGDGAAGQDGEAPGVAAEPGAPGLAGDAVGEPGRGGAGGDNPGCGLGPAGAGGDGGGVDGAAQPGVDGDARGGVEGDADIPGADGGPGPAGDHGLSGARGAAAGQLSGGWHPVLAGDGEDGAPGGGGGGGGGGYSPDPLDPDLVAGGGGGGGGGGCPGTGGAGGAGGGGSFALQIRGGAVLLVESRLEAGRGGDGGVGGRGGPGEPGAAGGSGAGHDGCADCTEGGDGGAGGDGGCGGNGGGGAGGPSLAVLLVGASEITLEALDGSAAAVEEWLAAGEAGRPGASPGRDGCGDPGLDGSAGIAAPIGCCAAQGRCATLECPE